MVESVFSAPWIKLLKQVNSGPFTLARDHGYDKTIVYILMLLSNFICNWWQDMCYMLLNNLESLALANREIDMVKCDERLVLIALRSDLAVYIEKYWFVAVTYAVSKYCLTPNWQIKLIFDNTNRRSEKSKVENYLILDTCKQVGGKKSLCIIPSLNFTISIAR